MFKTVFKVFIENTPSAVLTMSLLGLSLRFSQLTGFSYCFQCVSIASSINAVFQTTSKLFWDLHAMTKPARPRVRYVWATAFAMVMLPVPILTAKFVGVLWC